LKAPASLTVHWPDGRPMEGGRRDVLLAAAQRQVPGVLDILVIADGASEYVYLKFADRIERYRLEWV
jgi:hypothetical protein